MEKMKLHSPNLVQENITRIRELFPGCVTEAHDEHGKRKVSVDFDQLRQELSESIIEGPQERYHLNWPGKRESLLTANAPIAKTLRPCREESVDFDTTKNLFIEGDNLDALKLLQETYLGKVKMIYIDPPYNTGNDFIYEDDFAENAEEFLKRSNQKDEEGNRLVANTESNGRFHSDWLSMIYSRLKLARNLLCDEGVIFISIGDDEVSNLIKVCDDIFGAKNSAGIFVWEKKKKPSFLRKTMGSVTEYIVCYAKNYECVGPFIAGVGEEGKKYPFNNAGNTYSRLIFPPGSVIFSCSDQTIELQDMSEGNIRTVLIEDVVIENGKNKNPLILDGEWRYSQGSLDTFIADGDEIRISRVPFRPNYINRNERIKKTANLLSHRINSIPTNEDATEELRDLFGTDVMDYPKPTGLLKFFVKAVTSDDQLVVDFFAGSATLADAIIQANSEDATSRRFIMIQIPEACDEKSEALKSGFKTIADVSKERIRRAGTKIKENNVIKAPNLDIGFRVLKVDSSNMAEVYYAPDAIDQGQLKIFTDNTKPDRKPEDLLFQVLLDWGVDLSLPIRKETIQSMTVFFVDENALVACFDTGVNEGLVKQLAGLEPLRMVFRDNGFVSDAVKINVEQIFKQMSPRTEVKSI